MNIRMSNINSIADAIKTHPYMSKRQKDELLEHYNKAADETVKKAFAELSRRYEKELSAMALMTLRRDFGFGEIRLKRYARAFNRLMKQYQDFLDGAESNGVAAYYELKSEFPNCDEWMCEK